MAYCHGIERNIHMAPQNMSQSLTTEVLKFISASVRVSLSLRKNGFSFSKSIPYDRLDHMIERTHFSG